MEPIEIRSRDNSEAATAPSQVVTRASTYDGYSQEASSQENLPERKTAHRSNSLSRLGRTTPAASTLVAPRLQRTQKDPQDGPQEGRQTHGASAAIETSRNPPQSSHERPSIEDFRHIEAQNKKLQHRLMQCEETVHCLQSSLAESQAHEANIQEHLNQATATIFRLRPRRQEVTETVVQEDYRMLTMSIENWIEANCEEFLDNDLATFVIIDSSSAGATARPEKFKEILLRFQSKPDHWVEVKEKVLAAIIMRYVVDKVLCQPLSIFLSDREMDILTAIEISMGSMELKKAINSHPNFTERYPQIEQKLTNELYEYLQKALSNQEDSELTKQSLSKAIIFPAITLSQKIQSALSIWSFKYSDYWDFPPGEFATQLPDFLANIEDFRCINLSARGKSLKPATDLVRDEQRRRLLYVLDVFPGLYCQRVNAEGLSPVSTISQPELLVSFANNDTRTPRECAEALDQTVGRHNQGTRSKGFFNTAFGYIR
ncbi:hypothetical protein VE00_06924 [Pseudogymnoascus sp. WSF 3629]|nr:hypothetical protein VE00_06924 [Pseudogymnoascus sp. WSF 3629]